MINDYIEKLKKTLLEPNNLKLIKYIKETTEITFKCNKCKKKEIIKKRALNDRKDKCKNCVKIKKKEWGKNTCLECKKITKNKKFCSNVCSAIFNNKKRRISVETKNKISISMKRKKNTPELIKKRIEKRKQEDLLKQKKQEEEKQKIKERLEKILLKENIQILEPIDKVVQKYNFKCYCGNFFNRSLHNFIHQKSYYCNICNVNSGTSKVEREIKDLILKKDKNISIKTNSEIEGNEIDLIINNKLNKVGIEYDGSMWHSYGKSKYSIFNNYLNSNKQKNKHLNKTIICENNNTKLFHIFENEWLDKNKKESWKSIIFNSLNLSIKLNARDCYTKEVERKEKNNFIDKNHIQGTIESKINVGLFLKEDKVNLKKDTLISIMTFSVPRYNKEYEYELYRFCSLNNYLVRGGGSKLLKYFEKKYKPKSLISYGNRRWTNKYSNFYLSSGFKELHETNVSYYYFHESDINKFYSRTTYQKKKIELYFNKKQRNIDFFDKDLTGEMNLFNNGYRKIYDCGQLVFCKTY